VLGVHDVVYEDGSAPRRSVSVPNSGTSAGRSIARISSNEDTFGLKAGMHAEDAPVNECGDWEATKHVVSIGHE
jgi:hypothetical protein